jgi:hypothetical protein
MLSTNLQGSLFWRTNKHASLEDSKIWCPLVIVVHSFLVRVCLWMLACSLMWKKNLITKHPFESIGVVLWKWVQPTFKPNIQNLTNIFHIIYFQIYAWKCVIIVSSLNTFKYWVFLTPITTHKNNIPFEYLKKPNTISQDWTFEHKTFLNIDSHTCNHSSMLICTRLTFNYQMMFNEGQFSTTL